MSNKHPNRWYGWTSDTPDGRDFCLAPAPISTPLPPSVDLRPQFQPCYNQGQLGSCTANAIAGALEFDQRKQKLPEFTPARLFIYYNERVMEGTVDSDSGAQIRDGIKSVNQLGAPDETIWPYSDGPTKFKKKPFVKVYHEAKKHPALTYQRVPQTEKSMQAVLAGGLPFVFGFSVYASFESDEVAKSGILNMPEKGEQMMGGHAVVAVGYDATTRRFIVRNSWGTDWGQEGFFTIPFEYLTNRNLADDFWVVKQVK